MTAFRGRATTCDVHHQRPPRAAGQSAHWPSAYIENGHKRPSCARSTGCKSKMGCECSGKDTDEEAPAVINTKDVIRDASHRGGDGVPRHVPTSADVGPQLRRMGGRSSTP